MSEVDPVRQRAASTFDQEIPGKPPRGSSPLSRCKTMLRTATVSRKRWDQLRPDFVREQDEQTAGQTYALKILKPNTGLAELERQIFALDKLGLHRHITGLHGVYSTKKETCLLVDLAVGGDLLALLAAGPLSEYKSRLIFRQLASAIRFAHRNGIAHGALRPENILFADFFCSKVFVGGWGHSHITATDDQGEEVIEFEPPVSWHYAAPETILSGKWPSLPADMWALGVTLYALLTAELPYAGKTTFS